MGTISVSLPADGTTADVADYNTPLTTVVNEINGQLDNDNVASDAAIAGSKLADASVATAKLSLASTTWTPTATGWSSTTAAQYRVLYVGKLVICFIYVTGTSNSTSTSLTLPTAASTNMTYYEGTSGLHVDNGTTLTQTRWTVDTATPTVVTFYATFAGGGWTASGTKMIRATVIYEAA